MARLILFSFSYVFLPLFLAPLSPIAGQIAAHQGGAHVDVDAGGSASPAAGSDADYIQLSGRETESPGQAERPMAAQHEKGIRNRNLKTFLLSGIALLLVPLFAMIVDRHYLLKKAEDLQQKNPFLSEDEAYKEVLETSNPAQILTVLFGLLSIGLGLNFGVQIGRLYLSQRKMAELQKGLAALGDAQKELYESQMQEPQQQREAPEANANFE